MAGSALCGNNHRHSAGEVSLPEAAEVVIRNLGARDDSIVTVTRDVATDAEIGNRDLRSGFSGSVTDRPQRCLKPTTGAALKGPLLEENRHGESLRRVVSCGSAIAAPVPCWAVRNAHDGSPAPLRLKVDQPHASMTLRTTWASIFGVLLNRRFRSSRHRGH